MIDRIFVDTNVFVYALDPSELDKKAIAEAVLGELKTTHDLVVSTQVLKELYVALVRGPQPIGSSEVAEASVRAVSELTVVHIDVVLILEAIAASRAHRIAFWDSLILRAARRAGCDRVLTEDLNDGQEFDGVRVENPFAT